MLFLCRSQPLRFWTVAASLAASSLLAGCPSSPGSTTEGDGGGAGPGSSGSGGTSTTAAGGRSGSGGTTTGISGASGAGNGGAGHAGNGGGGNGGGGNGGAGNGGGGNGGAGNGGAGAGGNGGGGNGGADAGGKGGAGPGGADAGNGDAGTAGKGGAGPGGADAGDGSAGTAGIGGAGPGGADAGDGGDGTAGTGGSAGTGNSADGSAGKDASENDGGPIVAAGVRWIGRVDTSDSAGPRFSWSGTGFAAQFSGTSVGVSLNNDNVYFFQAVIDGATSTRFQAAKGQAVRTVASGLATGVHTLELYRETEASYGISQFLGITEGTLLAPPSAPARLLEFVGDSMSAGYGNLGSEPHPNYGDPNPCTFSFDTESAYLSYGAVAARALGADASLIAMSGWGIFRGRTSDTSEVLPTVYSNTLGLPASPVWDFHLQPQAVIINLGTNDFAPGDPGSDYTTALGAFIDTVRAKYPAAWIFCAVGTMYDTAQEVQAKMYVQSAVSSRGGDASKVAFVDLGSQDALQGTGCDWHPNVAEDQRIADTLVPVIKQKLGW